MAKRDLKHRGRILGNTGSDLENEGVGIRELPGSESETQGGRILGNRGSDSGHPSYLQPVVFNQCCLKQEVVSNNIITQHRCRSTGPGEVCVGFRFALFSSEE